ncbi:hypothetical protein MFU01_34660 [Myxococcus fulvus]|uniref:Uncharacterized protein n=1 Tax=Myxococcus fulvus TaxID=33 RepID=A0A511T2P1_MYXFU|nr:hypothetical protein MFU01_34660 [Myxococcus fulvus]
MRKLLGIASRPGAVIRLLRSARQAPAEALAYFGSEEGFADDGALSRYPRFFQVHIWRRIRATTRSPEIQNRAVTALVGLNHPPDNLIPYLWQCLTDGRLSMVAGTVLEACEPRLRDDELETILRTIEREAPAEDRLTLALVFFSWKRRARTQRFLEASGLWAWRVHVPRECGAIILTLMFPEDHPLACDVCDQQWLAPWLIIGPRATICAGCVRRGTTARSPRHPGCVFCGHAGTETCEVCAEHVETLMKSRTRSPQFRARAPVPSR